MRCLPSKVEPGTTPAPAGTAGSAATNRSPRRCGFAPSGSGWAHAGSRSYEPKSANDRHPRNTVALHAAILSPGIPQAPFAEERLMTSPSSTHARRHAGATAGAVHPTHVRRDRRTVRPRLRPVPEHLGPEQIRAYQVCLATEHRLATSSLLVAVAALRLPLIGSRFRSVADDRRRDPRRLPSGVTNVARSTKRADFVKRDSIVRSPARRDRGEPRRFDFDITPERGRTRGYDTADCEPLGFPSRHRTEKVYSQEFSVCSPGDAYES